MDHVYTKPVPPEPIPVPDFELFIGDKGGQIDNGDVPVRWCITQEYINKLEEDGILDPHVVIASYAPINKGEDKKYLHEMDRKMIPLTELMTYLRFSRAGKAKIYAIIVDGSEGREALHKYYTRKSGGDLGEIISRYSDDFYDDLPFQVKKTSAYVDIPAGVFGKEPSPWMKWYVNKWHDTSNKIVDECAYRRRWMIAFGIKWMVFIPITAIDIIIRVIITTLLIGAGYGKKIKFFKSFRPYKYPSMYFNLITDKIEWFDDTVFIRHRKNIIGRYPYSDTTPMFFAVVFSPVIIGIIAIVVAFMNPNGLIGHLALVGMGMLPIFAIGVFFDILIYVIEYILKTHIGEKFAKLLIAFVESKWMKGLILILVGTFIVLAGDLLIDLLGMLLMTALFTGGLLAVTVFFFNTQIVQWLLNKITISPEQNDYRSIHELLCPKEEDNLRPNIKYIPKNKRTIRLWYLDVKNKMCKPMQQ